MSFTSPSALCSRSASSLVDRRGVRLRGHLREPCRSARRPRASRARSRRMRTCFTVLPGESCEHAEEHPELDAVRVRLDLLRLARQLVRHAREDDGARPSAARNVSAEVRVRDDRLLEVRLARPCARRGTPRRARSRRACRAPCPSIDRVVLHDVGLVALRVDAELDAEGRPPLPVFEMIVTGLPVVSCRRGPAALMPMPCCPRDCFRRWNFEP